MKDACALIGLLSLAAGCYLIHPAAALIVVGILLLSAAICGHLRPRKGKQ